jgi:hypothetical protein
MDNFGFIITRHVNSEKTNSYWNQCVKLIRTFYPLKKIVVIDDNSNYEYVKSEYNYKNIQIIQSEFPKRGELLPYYYYLKHKFFQNAVIIHDSVFIHRRINFESLNGVKVLPLWHFNSDKENIVNTKRIIKKLRNSFLLESKLNNDLDIIGMNLSRNKNNDWQGCFGAQSYINLNFLQYIESKYAISNLVHSINCRPDRCCLERILGCIFSIEYTKKLSKKSLLGNIQKYHRWGYSYDEYIDKFKNKALPRIVIKVWTGR